MNLTKSQSKTLARYTELRHKLHGAMARVAHGNRAGDAGTSQKVALRHMKGLASRTAHAAKTVASAIPITRDEIQEQHAEDDRDYFALKKGEGVVVIGGDDGWTVEAVEAISPGWFNDRKNRELAKMGYSPFEIDPDLRLMAMLRSVGFGGVGEDTAKITKRIARLRKRLRYYRVERTRLRGELRSLPRNDKGMYASIARAEKIQRRLSKNERKAARTRGEIRILTAQLAGKMATKSTASRGNAIAQVLGRPEPGAAPIPAVVVQQTADQVAVAKQAVLTKAAALARVVADAEQAAAQVAELKANAATAAEVASGAKVGSKKADKALATARTAAAESVRLEGLLGGLAAQVQAATQDAADAYNQAANVVEAAAADFAATTGTPKDKVVSALLHEGESTTGDVAAAVAADTGEFGGVGWGGEKPSAEQVTGVIDSAMGWIGQIVGAFGPQQTTTQPPTTSYRPPSAPPYQPPPTQPAATNWTPILLAGGAAVGIGVLAAKAFAGPGGAANMLMSRDRDGEFVPRRAAAPGYLDYEGQSRYLPSRDRAGRFVAGTQRAPSHAGRASGYANFDEFGELVDIEFDG